MDYYATGLAYCVAVIDLDAELRNGTSPAVAFQSASNTCVEWEADVAAGPPPGDLGAETDIELANRAAIMAGYATWCDLAMVDPAAAAAQQPDLDLPDQAETDHSHAVDDAYAARQPAATTLGL